MIRLDPNLRWLYTEIPMAERLGAAAMDGFKGIEVAFPYETHAEQFRAELDAHDMTLVQILSPLRWDEGERGLAALPGREQDFRASMHTAVDYAVSCTRPLLHVALGNIPRNADVVQCYRVAQDNLRFAADLAASHDLTIIIEACCRDRLPNYMIHTIEEKVSLIESVGRDNVKLCFDTYHVGMEGGDLIQELDRAWPHIGHIQIGNAPTRHEPGRGDLDLHTFLNTLDQRSWEGWVGLEYTPSRSTSDSLRWAREMSLLPGRPG